MGKAKLYRCFITNVKKDHIVAKDVFGKKYIINKNNTSKKFAVGYDYSFYAFEEVKGVLIKKSYITPISDEEYAKMVGANNSNNDSEILKKLQNF